MDTRLRIAGIVGAVCVSAVILASPSPGVPLPDPATTAQDGSGSVAVLASGLDEPRAIAAHGDRVFVAEKSGAVRIVRDAQLLERPLASLRAAADTDSGLLGLAVHPDFASNGLLYAYLTYEEDARLYNRVMWLDASSDRVADAGTVIDGIPGSPHANGGAIAFGPDGKLYVGTGSASDASHAPQDPSSLAGKVLRLNDDGSVPGDNPVSGSAVYASGFRDPQAIGWDADARLVLADMGPSKNDEIALVGAGSNHGWPLESCSGGEHEAPVYCFDPAMGPGGLVVYAGGSLAEEGSIIIASLQASGIYALDAGGDGVSSILGGLGRVRDVAAAPDGALYAITSNTDARGFASDADDRLIEVRR